jgi:hypothetical protein
MTATILTTSAWVETPKHSPEPLKPSTGRVSKQMSKLLCFRGGKTSDSYPLGRTSTKSKHCDTIRSLYLDPSSACKTSIYCEDSTVKGCLKVTSQCDSLNHIYGSADAEKSPKSLKWSTIDFYSHEMVLGDNPSVSSGPPIMISWKSHEHYPISIDDYEKYKPERRRKIETLVPRQRREDLLIRAGYNRSDLKEAANEAASIRRMRHKSLKDGQWKATLLKWKVL